MIYRIRRQSSRSWSRCGKNSTSQRWELLCGILGSLSVSTFSGTLLSHSSLFSRSSGLPDNVFDPGERPAKLVQKRVKVGFLTQVNLTLKMYTEPLERKGAGKSTNTSPDMPNKRQRLVFAHSSFMRMFVYASSSSPFSPPAGLHNRLWICRSRCHRKMDSRRVCCQ